MDKLHFLLEHKKTPLETNEHFMSNVIGFFFFFFFRWESHGERGEEFHFKKYKINKHGEREKRDKGDGIG